MWNLEKDSHTDRPTALTDCHTHTTFSPGLSMNGFNDAVINFLQQTFPVLVKASLQACHYVAFKLVMEECNHLVRTSRPLAPRSQQKRELRQSWRPNLPQRGPNPTCWRPTNLPLSHWFH